MSPYLEIEGVSRRFEQFVALSGVSLTVAQGEFVCFLGPSGCGKTTLLRIIAGLDFQDEGRVVQAGRDVSGLPASKRDFGIVFQSYALFPNLTVAANVGYGLKGRGIGRSAIDARVAELLELVGLTELARRFPAQISGGQQQRVALARALASSPGLLLLDEPFSALDARVRQHLRSEMKELQRRLGVTTIMVTHDQEEALSMADRIVVMEAGRIAQIGTPEEIYSRPGNAFVASFIGEMNFLPGHVRGAGRVQLAGGLDCVCDTTGFADGSAITAAIRPEHVKIGAAAAAERNKLGGEISRIEFLGPVVRAHLGAGALGTASLRVDMPQGESARLASFGSGPLDIALPPASLRLFAGA
jgi:iron(III) transport system ATP-binding protein